MILLNRAASRRPPVAAPATTGTTVARLATLLVAGIVVLGRWRARARQRRALAELDDRLLRDIGLTRAQARRACRKSPWRA